MNFQRTNGGVVRFCKPVVETLLRYRQFNLSDREAGGMLFGTLLLDCEDLIVDEVSVPLNSDKRTRFSFFRAKEDSQKIINRKWVRSQGARNYLGEWHTHPEDDPTPSQTIDIPNWHRITKNAVVEQESLFFVIVGNNKIRMWEANKLTAKITELTNTVDMIVCIE